MTKEELKAYRESLDMTQEQFGLQFGLSGKAPISHYENGIRPVPTWLVYAIELRQRPPHQHGKPGERNTISLHLADDVLDILALQPNPAAFVEAAIREKAK